MWAVFGWRAGHLELGVLTMSVRTKSGTEKVEMLEQVGGMSRVLGRARMVALTLVIKVAGRRGRSRRNTAS